jgi:hypothetical protein
VRKRSFSASRKSFFSKNFGFIFYLLRSTPARKSQREREKICQNKDDENEKWMSEEVCSTGPNPKCAAAASNETHQ